MKKTLVIASMLCATSLLYAQGQLNFDTSVPGAKVLEATGYSGAGAAIGNTVAGSVTGTQFLMQLYAASGTVADSSSLVAVGNPVNARGGTINGGFSQTSGTTTLGWALNKVVTVGYLGTATVQLRAWWAGNTTGAFGTTYTSYYSVEDTSATAALMRSGFSPLITLTLGNPATVPPGTPADLVGLAGFQLTDVPIVPEPSTFALLGLGALGMLIFRRK